MKMYIFSDNISDFFKMFYWVGEVRALLLRVVDNMINWIDNRDGDV